MLSDVVPVGAWWALAAMAVVVHPGVCVPWMPTPKSRTQAALALPLGVLVATGLHALEGRSVAGLVLLTLPLFVGVGLVLGG
ncbi:hypothetical protein [Streptomyces seoulensis]|uniref:hypothetical protein n=1 Tax=Streptomyces seoulensis TaxID=73044 RepID=UPI0033AFD668